MRRNAVMVPLVAILFAAMGFFFFGPEAQTSADPPKDTTTTTTAPAPGAPCNATNHFFAADVTGHKFGPAAPTTAPEAVAELKHRISCGQDAALAVTLAEYVQCNFSSPEERVAKTATAIGNPDVWNNFHAAAVNQALDAGNPRIETMKGPYKTLYMTLDGGRIVPEVYSTNPDRPTFQVLRIDTPCGVKNFKLDCGFQPVEQTFPPTIPTKPGKPSKSQPPKETIKHPTTSTPGSTPPPAPTTAPPPGATTVPPPSTPKCANQTGPHCGTPDSGPDLIPVQDNNPAHVAPTPGYVPGNAEKVIPSQPVGTGSSYTPTPAGSAGTGAGGVTPVGQTDTPSGPVNGGTSGASNGASTEGSAQTSSGDPGAP